MTATYTAGFLFCGLGAGARGFLDATGKLGLDAARFTSVGGIDNDPVACAAFEYLTKSRATCADISQMQPSHMRAALGERRPDVLFGSPPCKGYSRLLSTEKSKTEKYQALNRLVLQGAFLACESWDEPPPVYLVENVEGILSRGSQLLAQVRQLLGGYGYVFHEHVHDLGPIGGLAQHRRRYLMLARRPEACSAYIYRPIKQRVRGCGEVLGELPMPEDPAAGEYHKLPKLAWINWVRLACIPAGGDWRDLPQGPVTLAKTAENAGSFKGRPGLMRVNDWEEPLPTVTGSASVSGSNGTAAVADPRGLGLSDNPGRHHNKYTVTPWDDPALTVTGATRPGSGALNVADPRALAKNIGDRTRGGALGVVPWNAPMPTVTGSMRPGGSNTPAAVADPRLVSPMKPGDKRRKHFRRHVVTSWTEPSPTIAGSGSNAPTNVADPRLGHAPRRDSYGVNAWDGPAKTVRGRMDVRQAPAAVADPRPLTADLRCAPMPLTVDPGLTCKGRNGFYGVVSWQEAMGTVTGSMSIDNAPAAVADPRDPKEAVVPVIIAADGTWHRPLTTLELAALQGIPTVVDGKPLALPGCKSVSHAREMIGNAVPVQAAAAMATTVLKALLAHELGTWIPGTGGVWVNPATGETDADDWRADDGRGEAAGLEQLAATAD